jgi:hypothetical protein
MRVLIGAPKWFVHGLFVMASAVSIGGEGLHITISNNTTNNLVMTVYDLNADPVVRVLSSETINGFATVSVSIAADGSGMGHLSWTAITTDPDMRTCGHGDTPNLSDGDTVSVSADSECGP